jgi:hypothetical protein
VAPVYNGKLITLKGAVFTIAGIKVVVEEATIEVLDIRKEVSK